MFFFFHDRLLDWPGAGVSLERGRPGTEYHSQKLLDPGQVFLSKGGARGRIHILKSYWARGRCFSRKGAPGNQKVWLNGRTGAGVSLERGRPVRDQGGIKAGPRRDHILFNLFVTDSQLQTVLFSCIFPSDRHLHYISHLRY